MISPGLITKGFGTENVITKGYGGIFAPIIKVVTEVARRIGKGGSNAYYQAKNFVVQLKEVVVYGRIVQQTKKGELSEVVGHEMHKFYSDRIVEIKTEGLAKGNSTPDKEILVEIEQVDPIEPEYLVTGLGLSHAAPRSLKSLKVETGHLVKEALLYTKGITKK